MSAILPASMTVDHNQLAQRYLFGPIVDFMLLGGGSLLILLILRLSLGNAELSVSFTATLILANVINHPHFAHSYQMFYRDFGKKISSYPRDLCIRYLVSGVVVPVLLISFFASTIIFDAPRIMGLAANLMFFLVGWHYVKQGYGMAMVDAVLKRGFYSDIEKKRLLQNAYAVWIFSWLLVNYLIGAKEVKYFEISYFIFPVSTFFLVAAGLICAATTVRLLSVLIQRRSTGKTFAWNGLLAYFVSVYAWLLIRDPLVLLWIPLFHSLQYLTVVWRYEINRHRAKPSAIRPAFRFGLFVVCGFGMGYLGFWALPEWLNANVQYSKELFGTSLFLYVFWIFINVHHYTLDAVMWRKGNPDVQAHLFTH